MNRKLILSAVSLIIFFSVSCSQEKITEKYSGPFEPFMSCNFENGLSLVASNQRPSGNNYREIKTSTGTKNISVIDGFRLGFAYPDRSYLFANVKIEQSDPKRYNQDKEIILEYLNSIEDTTKIQIESNGFTVTGQEASEIDQGGVIGMYVFFSDPDQMIISNYLLNQEKDKRIFNNIAEFKKVRDSFFKRYTECIKNN